MVGDRGFRCPLPLVIECELAILVSDDEVGVGIGIPGFEAGFGILIGVELVPLFFALP